MIPRIVLFSTVGRPCLFRLICTNDKEGARSVRMLESLEVVRLRK